ESNPRPRVRRRRRLHALPLLIFRRFPSLFDGGCEKSRAATHVDACDGVLSDAGSTPAASRLRSPAVPLVPSHFPTAFHSSALVCGVAEACTFIYRSKSRLSFSRIGTRALT